MPDRKGLHRLGLLYGGLTALVTLVAAMVVSTHIGAASQDRVPAATEITSLSRQ